MSGCVCVVLHVCVRVCVCMSFCECVCVCVRVFERKRSCGDDHAFFHLSRGDTCNCGDKILVPIITVSKNA